MKVKLTNVRLSFPDLFEPRPFKPGDTPKFKATFLIPKDSPQIKTVKDAILAVAKEKWPKDYQKIVNSIQGNANKFCFQDGDNKTYDGYEGMMALTAGNKTRPGIFDRDRSPLAKDDGRPYAGCYVNGVIELFAYDNSGNGIAASLTGVQFHKDGEAFSGGRPASADEFDDLGVDEEEAFA
jgi:hypothetical protein